MPQAIERCQMSSGADADPRTLRAHIVEISMAGYLHLMVAWFFACGVIKSLFAYYMVYLSLELVGYCFSFFAS